MLLALAAATLNIVANGRSLRELLYSVALAIVLVIAVTSRPNHRRI